MHAVAATIECPHSRSLAVGRDTAISQATTVPFGFPVAEPDSQATEHVEEIEVDEEGESKANDVAATAGEGSTFANSPEGGVSDALEELRPLMEPPVPVDPN